MSAIRTARATKATVISGCATTSRRIIPDRFYLLH